MFSATPFKFFCIVACLVIYYCISIAPELLASKNNRQQPIVSIDVRDKGLKEVLKDISDTSGYDIILNGEKDDLSISLKLQDVALDDMIKRVLRDVNYTIVWDNLSRKILLSVYGKQEVNFRQSPMTPTQNMKRLNAAQHLNNPPGAFPRSVPGPNGKRIRHTIKRGGRPAFSLSGRQTRFAQTTSTIQ